MEKICFDINLKQDLLKKVSVTFLGKKLEYYTYPGVSSYKKTHKGILYLAQKLPDDLKPNKILNVGCGNGILSILASIKYPESEIHAVDIDPRAVALSIMNLSSNSRVTAWGSHNLDQIVDYDYSMILITISSNCPEEIKEILTQAYNHTRPEGVIYIFAENLTLKSLQKPLQNIYGNAETEKRHKDYIILSARK
ncbi:methyltransferase [Candidatus Dojkabacteria bacterium]|nr:methyltransferase [Candidatus Dojkabacteria bacterium]